MRSEFIHFDVNKSSTFKDLYKHFQGENVLTRNRAKIKNIVMVNYPAVFISHTIAPRHDR